MSVIRTVPGLSEQIYQAVLDEICDGELSPGAHLVQEQLAERFGVSRQPIQQAMALLKADGLIIEAGKRGLHVAPIDLSMTRYHYEIRSALDVLAAGLAAERVAADPKLAKSAQQRGEQFLKKGNAARKKNAVREQIRHDEEFHHLIYELSGNPLLGRTAEIHWRYLRRVMGEVLRQESAPESVWEQHKGILDCILKGDDAGARKLAQTHIAEAAEMLMEARGTEADGHSAAS